MKNLSSKNIPAILICTYIAALAILTLLWSTDTIGSTWSAWMLPFLAVFCLIMIASGLFALAISSLIIALPFMAVLQLFIRTCKWPILLLSVYIGLQIVLLLLYWDGQIDRGTATLPWALAWLLFLFTSDIPKVKDPYGGIEPPHR